MKRTLVALLLVGLAGCSGGGSETKATPTPTVASPTPSPTPTDLTIGQARARYLAIVKPSNDAKNALSKGINAKKGWRTLRSLAGKVAVTNRAFGAALLSTRWPASVKPTAQKLAEAVAHDSVEYRYLTRAKTKAEWDEALSEFNLDPDGSKYAEVIRTQLGLPPAP